jgi:histidine triad (HIT) family protein
VSDCTFCKIIDGTYENSNIYEDDSLIAFLDIHPVNAGHILIVPKKHAELISELDDETTGRMFILAKEINKALRKSGVKLEGINYFLADGEAAGQEVFHTHFHLIPRFAGDGFGLKFPAGYKNNLPKREELDLIAEGIRKKLKII